MKLENAISIRMIKIWVLFVFLSLPNTPGIKHISEITYSEQECQVKKELKSVFTEQWALKNGIEQFYYEVKCVETKMYNNIGT